MNIKVLFNDEAMAVLSKYEREGLRIELKDSMAERVQIGFVSRNCLISENDIKSYARKNILGGGPYLTGYGPNLNEAVLDMENKFLKASEKGECLMIEDECAAISLNRVYRYAAGDMRMVGVVIRPSPDEWKFHYHPV